MIWDDRLAEVWADPGKAGAGVVVGVAAVLTARHVVAGALDRRRILARVVRPGARTADWVPMTVLAEDADWDVALLGVSDSDVAGGDSLRRWLGPTSPSPVFVRLGTSAEHDCEAVGFPQAEVRDAPDGSLATTVRQSEHAVGTLAPASQAKAPVNAERPLPRRWIPFDVEGPAPDTEAGWGGMSGAAVVLADGRLAGIVVDAEAGHQQRRLYVVPLAAALTHSADLSAAMAAVVGAPPVAEARYAPIYRRVLYRQSLHVDGTPLRLGDVTDLGVFGVKPVNFADEPTYLNYVPRDDDDRLTQALRDAAAAKYVLLLVGDSGAGKSRSAAEATRRVFGAHRLLRPVEHELAQLPDIPLADLAPTLVWLDDIEKYVHPALGEILGRLLDAGTVVVGTVRRQELQALTATAEIRNPSGPTLTNEQLVQRLDWKREWSQSERDRTTRHVTNPLAQRAVAAGLPLGVWAVAGPQLVNKLTFAQSDEDYPCRFALVRAVLDWYRTGLIIPTPQPVAIHLIRAYVDQPTSDEDGTDAIRWSTEPIDVGGRRGRYSLLMLQDGGLVVNDYIQDYDSRHNTPTVPALTWSAALGDAPDAHSIWRVGVAAHQSGSAETAKTAWQAFTEVGGTEEISNFIRMARGQRSAARGGDLFRGRRAAVAAVRGWLTADEPPGQALVITGQPGAGKSAVLARAALSVEAEHSGPVLMFHARGRTFGDFFAILADLIGLDTPASTDELINALMNAPDTPPIRLVVDALDEVASDHDRRQITDVLAELAVLPGLRVAVATRPLTVGNRYTPGGLLAALGVTTRDDHNLVDLDSDTYFDLDDLRQFAAALLAQDGMDHPGPPGAAWTHYRSQPAVRDRLAAVIAERAGRNFLVTALAAGQLSTAPINFDPAARGFDPAKIESGAGEALSKYLDQLPEERRERVRALLTALAYARGAGLDDSAWLAFAAALGYSVSVADLDALRRSPAADYLFQTTTTERGARPVTRLFHQALTDELLAARHQPSDESALFDMLLGQAEHTGWQDRYVREHTAEHAAAAGRLDELLEDPLYLITVDPARLVPHLDAARSAPARAAATVYRQSAHLLARLDRRARASQLELTAHRLGCHSLAARIAGAAPG